MMLIRQTYADGVDLENQKGETMPHPMQEIVVDDNDVYRFRRNNIVRFLLDSSRFTLNDLARMDFSQEDWAQLAQLIGYSVSGYGDLSYAIGVAEADEICEKMQKANSR